MGAFEDYQERQYRNSARFMLGCFEGSNITDDDDDGDDVPTYNLLEQALSELIYNDLQELQK